MKLKIEKITRKEVDTQRGKAWKLGILCNNEWFSAWSGDWNKTWREGQTVDVEVKDVTGRNGTVYHNIQTPRPTNGRDNVLDEILNRQTQLMTELLEIKKILSSSRLLPKTMDTEPPPLTDDDRPPEGEELPF